MKKFLVIIGLILLLFYSESYGGVAGEMEKLFTSLGGGANYTEGGAYQTQSGGYYTGGSLYARVPSRTHQFLNFQTPSIKSGCSGIDIFQGSFSYIKSEQLVNAMRSIMGNTAGYSFNLALQTFVPQVYNTMQKLNDIAREINNFNINDCKASMTAVNGLWPKSERASSIICESMGAGDRNKFDDWTAAKHGCGTGGKREEVNSTKAKGFEDQLGDEFNIAWEAIKKQDLFGNDKELAELFMSISGTIIGRKKGERIEIVNELSLINEVALLDMFLYGESKTGEVPKIYKCDEYDKCLNLHRQELKVEKSKALVPKLEDMLRKMADKMRIHEGSLTANEKSLIELTQIPVLKIIGVQNAFMVGNSIMNINEFVDGIAYDYLLGYMEKVLDFVSINLSQLESVQISGTHIAEFKQDIVNVRRIITDKRFGAYQRMVAVISVIEKSNLSEKKVEQMFTSYNEVIS